LKPLCDLAKKHGVVIVTGFDERDDDFSTGTIYNSVAIVDADGTLLNRHRKLMPTNPERMVHGFGDASGLRVVDTAVGRVGALICWENYMPLARFALYAQGVDIYVAPTYDQGDLWVATMRHIAMEGRCWVVGCGSALRGSDYPTDIPGHNKICPDPNEWINDGDSIVVSPLGAIAKGPLRQKVGILCADIEVAESAAARRTLDVAGHYGRPDVFQLSVNRARARPIVFSDPSQS
jgi:nitrilase